MVKETEVYQFNNIALPLPFSLFISLIRSHMSHFILFTFHFHSICEIYVMIMAHNPLKNAQNNGIINM